MRWLALQYLIVFLLAMCSGSFLMNISQHVQRSEREIKVYDKKIANIGEDIRVLNAEWAYLNNPMRLELLASKGGGLVSPEAMDLISTFNISPDSIEQKLIYSRSSLYRDISYMSYQGITHKKYKPVKALLNNNTGDR